MRFDKIFTDFKPMQRLNVYSSITVILDGIVMDDNESHPQKAQDPIDVTEGGRIIDVRFVHC